jgi:hypothetical protein
MPSRRPAHGLNSRVSRANGGLVRLGWQRRLPSAGLRQLDPAGGSPTSVSPSAVIRPRQANRPDPHSDAFLRRCAADHTGTADDDWTAEEVFRRVVPTQVEQVAGRASREQGARRARRPGRLKEPSQVGHVDLQHHGPSLEDPRSTAHRPADPPRRPPRPAAATPPAGRAAWPSQRERAAVVEHLKRAEDPRLHPHAACSPHDTRS